MRVGGSCIAIGLMLLGIVPSRAAALSDLETYEYWRERAEEGDVEGLFNIGYHYSVGKGVEQDHVAAARWYRKAAKRDHAMAQHNLGVLYRDGTGVEKDLEQAFHWEQKAAAQGNEIA